MGRDRRMGLRLATITAVVSGVAVFVNSYGVRSWSEMADPTTYTTVKNGVAALVLAVAGLAARRAGLGDAPQRVESRRGRLGVVVIAVIGGSIPFVLFFEGLAAASSGQAAFIHKTLVVWVAMLAPLFLRERVRGRHVTAIGLLVAGQFLLVGGVADISWGRGETLILAATLLWSIEVIVAKHILGDISSMTVGVARMAGGAGLLIGWGLLRGSMGAVLAVGPEQWGWVLLTGGLLAGYVGSWYAALARAGAVDVTAVLVGGAVITAVLRSGLATVPIPDTRGLALIGFGTLAVLVAAVRPRAA